jgi:hypothetical protein
MRNGNAKVSRTCAPSNRYGGHTRLDQRRCSAALSGHHLSKIATKARRGSRPASRQRLPPSPLRTRCGRGGHRPAPGDLHAGSPLVSRAKRVACTRFLQELSPTTCRLPCSRLRTPRDEQKQDREENHRNLMNAECIARATTNRESGCENNFKMPPTPNIHRNATSKAKCRCHLPLPFSLTTQL